MTLANLSGLRRAARSTLAVAAAALAFCLPALAQPEAPAARGASLKIGVIGPFSGASADFGLPMLNGIMQAVDEINAVGGYAGHKIEIVQKDDQANPELGLKLSQELVAEKVVATLGFCNTGVAARSLEVYQAQHVPLIIPCATGAQLTKKYPAPESYVFHTAPSDAIQAPFVVDDLVKRGWDKVAVFADTTGYGESGLKDALAALAARQLQPVHVARFDLGVKDLAEPLKAARAAGANVLLSYTVGTESAVIARGRQALGWKVPQAGPWTLSFPFFIDGAKDAAEGAVMAQSFIAEPSNEHRAAFLSGYARKFKVKKIPVPMAAAQGYDAVYVLLHALFNIKDGKLGGPAVKAALESRIRTYYGVTATYEQPFSAQDKEATTQNMLVMGMVKNGAVTFAYPEDARRNLFVQRKQ